MGKDTGIGGEMSDIETLVLTAGERIMANEHELMAALAEPFDPSEVKFKPAVVSGNRALALGYIDARVVQDRLDEVLGVVNWKDSYKFLEDGSCLCKLSVRVGKEWITKMDVGGQSEQSDEGDRRKAALSDALKRTAVKFGIGRYLYRLPNQWVDYDPHKKQFTKNPRLPDFALPKRKDGKSIKQPEPQPARQPEKTSGNMPASGKELEKRVYDYEAKLAKQGVCALGELAKHLHFMGKSRGYSDKLSEWSGDAILDAAEWTKAFESGKRAAMSQKARAS